MSGLRNVLPPKTKVQTSPLASGSKKASVLVDGEDAITLSSTPSYIHLIFSTPVPDATHLALTFQGGFVGTSAMVYVATKPKEGSAEVELGLMMGARIHPEDKSRRQIFKIPYPANLMVPRSPVTNLPTAMTSQGSLGPSIRTEVPPNPLGGGAPAQKLDGAYSQFNGSTMNGDGQAAWGLPELTELKIEFEQTSDNQGRVTLYQVEILA